MEIFIPFFVMSAPVLIILIVMGYRSRQMQARYRMLVDLADKGVELSPQLLLEPQVVYSERRRALVLIGTGLGLMATFLALPGHFDNGYSLGSLWGLGLLPLIIGLGYLLSWWLNQRDNQRG